eukprot:6458477-Amphidinium_carterae.2
MSPLHTKQALSLEVCPCGMLNTGPGVDRNCMALLLLGGARRRKKEDVTACEVWRPVDEYLQVRNLERVETAGDGSCLFHAMGRPVGWNPRALRHAICAWLEDVPPPLLEFWHAPCTPAQEAARLRQPHAWG